MKKTIYIVLFIFFILFTFAFTYKVIEAEENRIELNTTTRTFVAGKSIVLKFTSDIVDLPLMIIHHSYGSTLLEATKKGNQLKYSIPKEFSNKTGVLDWSIVLNEKILLTNSIEIIPDTKSKTTIESYLGPRSINAGKSDYSMFVVIPKDNKDNPLPVNTEVKVHEQFLDKISFKNIKTKNFIAWHNVMAKEKAGSILVSASSNGINTKEFTTEIYPSNPTNFYINYNRDHKFADGNQLTEFTTSSILDKYGNVISDGTLVEFIITNSKNNILKTRASTINGYAKAKILNPERAELYKVKAFINGLAESNEISVKYSPVINDFNIQFRDGNRKITIGPIYSFMNQLIPDGAIVKLSVFHQDKLIETEIGYSKQGFVYFNLSPEFYKEKTYSFSIETLGITKNIEIKNYTDVSK